MEGFPLQKQPSRGDYRKVRSENMLEIYRRSPMQKCDFNKVALQLCWNHALTWVFSCKFAAIFRTFVFLRTPQSFFCHKKDRLQPKWKAATKNNGMDSTKQNDLQKWLKGIASNNRKWLPLRRMPSTKWNSFH